MTEATEVISLAERRAEAEGNATLWSVEDCLAATLRDLRAGKIKADMVYIALHARDEENVSNFRYRAAGGNRLEMLGLLVQHLCSGAVE